MRNRAVALALAGAFFPTLLAIWSIRQTLPRFSDPCFQWGVAGHAAVRIARGAPCASVSGTSETRGEAAVRLALVAGGILAAGVLAVAGACAQRPLLPVLMLMESLQSFAWLTVLAAALFLLAARESAPLAGAARAGARVLAVLAAVAALLYLPALARGAPLFAVLLEAALGGTLARRRGRPKRVGRSGTGPTGKPYGLTLTRSARVLPPSVMRASV